MAPLLALVRVVPVWAWALAALLAWGAWQKHRATVSTRAAAAAEQSAAVQAEAAKAERAARELEQTYATNVQGAANAYSENLRRARAAAADTRSELERLRDATAATAPNCAASPGATAASGVDGAAGLREVLGSCARSLSELAAIADSDAARVTALQDYIKAIGASKP
jgi:hypothetical protein